MNHHVDLVSNIGKSGPIFAQENISKQFLEIMKGIARTSFTCVFILDIENEKINFLSENPFLHAGLNSNEIEELGYNYYRKYIRKEDLGVFKAVNTSGFKFFECLTVEEKKTYTITFDFHIKNCNHCDLLVNHALTPVEFDENGNIIKLVCAVSYSHNRTAGNICVSSALSDIDWKYNILTGKWSGEPKIILKGREMDIIRLCLQGLNIEEIADRLCVSPNTVKFHRSKLFEKIGVNNISEAISYVKSHKLI